MDIILLPYAFIIGICFGSFGNLMAYRLHNNISIVKPRSSCISCGITLNFPELIPVFGWFIIRGKCKKCKIPVPFHYPLIECICGLLFTIVTYKVGLSWELPFYIAITFTLLIIALTDIKSFDVPDQLVIVGLTAGLVFFLLNPLHWVYLIYGLIIC